MDAHGDLSANGGGSPLPFLATFRLAQPVVWEHKRQGAVAFFTLVGERELAERIRTSRRRAARRGQGGEEEGESGEPSVDDTVAILRGLKERYEVHHGVRIQDSACIAAATLSHRYIADRFLPDKAIDVMDEAGASLRLQPVADRGDRVTVEMIENIVAKMARIPAKSVSASDRDSLRTLERDLKLVITPRAGTGTYIAELELWGQGEGLEAGSILDGDGQAREGFGPIDLAAGETLVVSGEAGAVG